MGIIAQDQITLTDLTDISYTKTWYRLATSAPSAPSNTHTSGDPTGTDAKLGWVQNEPPYDSDYHLYTVIQNVFGDGSCVWGLVQLSSFYNVVSRAVESVDEAIVARDRYYYEDIQENEPAQPIEINHPKWTTTRPTYSTSKKGYIWYSDRTEKNNGDIDWSPVGHIVSSANLTQLQDSILSTVSSTYVTESGMESYTSSIKQTAEAVSYKFSVAEASLGTNLTNAATTSQVNQAKSDAEKTATTYIHQSGQGIIVGKSGNDMAAYINASNASFDVNTVSWSGNTPTLGNLYASFGAGGTTLYGVVKNAVKKLSEFTGSGMKLYSSTDQVNPILSVDGSGMILRSPGYSDPIMSISDTGLFLSNDAAGMWVTPGGTGEQWYLNLICSRPNVADTYARSQTKIGNEYGESIILETDYNGNNWYGGNIILSSKDLVQISIGYGSRSYFNFKSDGLYMGNGSAPILSTAGKAISAGTADSASTLSNTLPVSKGGTGKTSFTAHRLLLTGDSSTTGNFRILASTAEHNGKFLMSNGLNSDPSWSSISVSASDISGKLTVSQLPTGSTSTTVALGNHTHGASDITSGTLNINRIPTGSSSSTVALGNHTHSTLQTSLIKVVCGDSIECFRSDNKNTSSLGNTSYRWSTVYLQSNPNVTSDRKEKDSFGDVDFAYDLIMSLKPITYMRKDGSHRRKHMGFIAQDVSDICKGLGQNLSLFSASYNDEDKLYGVEYLGEEVADERLDWSLSYEQFIAPIVAVIQSQNKRIAELESKLNEIKG